MTKKNTNKWVVLGILMLILVSATVTVQTVTAQPVCTINILTVSVTDGDCEARFKESGNPDQGIIMSWVSYKGTTCAVNKEVLFSSPGEQYCHEQGGVCEITSIETGPVPSLYPKGCVEDLGPTCLGYCISNTRMLKSCSKINTKDKVVEDLCKYNTCPYNILDPPSPGETDCEDNCWCFDAMDCGTTAEECLAKCKEDGCTVTSCSVSTDMDLYFLGETVTISYNTAPAGSTLSFFSSPGGINGQSWSVSGTGSETYTLQPTDKTGAWEVSLAGGSCSEIKYVTVTVSQPPVTCAEQCTAWGYQEGYCSGVKISDPFCGEGWCYYGILSSELDYDECEGEYCVCALKVVCSPNCWDRCEGTGCRPEGPTTTEGGGPTTTTEGEELSALDEIRERITEAACYILSILITLVGAVAALFIILAGIKYMGSGDDPSGRQEAKSRITWALIGLAIAIIACPLVEMLKIPPLQGGCYDCDFDMGPIGPIEPSGGCDRTSQCRSDQYCKENGGESGKKGTCTDKIPLNGGCKDTGEVEGKHDLACKSGYCNQDATPEPVCDLDLGGCRGPEDCDAYDDDGGDKPFKKGTCYSVKCEGTDCVLDGSSITDSCEYSLYLQEYYPDEFLCSRRDKPGINCYSKCGGKGLCEDGECKRLKSNCIVKPKGEGAGEITIEEGDCWIQGEITYGVANKITFTPTDMYLNEYDPCTPLPEKLAAGFQPGGNKQTTSGCDGECKITLRTYGDTANYYYYLCMEDVK